MAIPRSISANCTRLTYAVEKEGILPENLDWKGLDPASYTGDFGATPQFTSADTVGSGRAPRKGRLSGKEVGVAFENYMRQKELQPFLPGFFINFPIETPSTNKLRPPASNPSTVTAVTATRGYTGTNFTAANGWTTGDGNYLVVAEGFTNRANNGLREVTGVAATSLTVRGATTAEPSPPSGASLEVCGYVANKSGELPALTYSGGILSLASTLLGEGGALALTPGTFVYLGGDTPASKFAQSANEGWARVSAVSTAKVDFDLTTFTPVADAGKATTQVFIPTRVFRDDIQCDASRVTTYAFERRLGKSDTTNPHEQSQLVTGGFPNQLDFAMGTNAEVRATLTFMGRESFRRDGKSNATQPWSGADPDPIDESALYNTSDDIQYAQLYRHDSNDSKRQDVIGKILDGNFTLNNNAKGIPAWGVFGNYDVNPGKLMVDTTVNALFTSTEALDLAEDSIDAGFFLVFARGHSGYILDVPLVTVQSSSPTVDSDEPIMISITNQGNESAFGYAASLQYFDYLPTTATE